MNSLPSFRFTYRAQQRTGDLLSSYEISALAILLRQGIVTDKVTLSLWDVNWRTRFYRKPSHQTLTLFLKQLLSLLIANVPLLHAMLLLKETHPKRVIRFIATQMALDLERGTMLSSALQNHCAHLGSAAISLLTMAENNGTLIPVLTQVITQREQLDVLSKKIRQALRYPLALLTFSLLIIQLLLMFVIPQFTLLYQQMGSTLPASTQLLLSMSQNMHQYGVIASVIAMSFILLIYQSFQKIPFLKKMGQYFLYYCPITHRLTTQLVSCRVLHCLAIALNAHSPILTALTHAQEAANHIVFANALSLIRQQLRQGVSLSHAFSLTTCFSKEIIHFIRMGEESGQIAQMFSELATLSQQQSENKLQQVSELVEPAMMLIIGGFIGFVLMSLYGPILSLGAQMG